MNISSSFKFYFVIITLGISFGVSHSVETRYCSDFVGEQSFCKYEVGDVSSKILINSPHGGSLEPLSIKTDRNYGCYKTTDKSCTWSHDCGTKSSQCTAKVFKDSWTKEIAEALRDRIHSLTGLIIISILSLVGPRFNKNNKYLFLFQAQNLTWLSTT